MTPVVVAWCVQLAWEIVRSSLGSDAFTTRPIVLSFAVTLATTLVAAAGFAMGARQLTGRRRVGAIVATVAQLALAGLLIAREVLGLQHSWGLARVLRNEGWTAGEIVTLVGLAIAASRRGKWIAAPAIALVILALPPSTVLVAPLPLAAFVMRAIVIALCVLLIADVERSSAAGDPQPARAERGVVVNERLSWFFAALEVGSLVTTSHLSMGPALGFAIANIAGGFVFVPAVWSIASARVPRLPRWPLYAAATCSLISLVRTVRVWTMTLVLHWGALDTVNLKPVHWAYGVPAMLSSAFVLAAFGAFAWSSHRRTTLILLRANVLSLVGWFVAAFVGADHWVLAAVLVMTNVSSALLYRSLRSAFASDVPAARVV